MKLYVLSILTLIFSALSNANDETEYSFKNTLPIIRFTANFQIISNSHLKQLSSICNYAAPRKLALIIAISNYDQKQTGWKETSAMNDVPLILAALKRQAFLDNNITLIQNSACTKAGIIHTIRSKLIDSAKPGDVILLHYSGHGQQIYDDNGDEVDGYDEALVPIDAPYNFNKNSYRGENHLRDDELGKLLDEIRIKVGSSGEVVFTIDACHSGSITRGALVRGSQDPFAPKGYRPKRQTGEKEFSGYLETSSSPGAHLNLAPFIIISASRYDQANYETISDDRKSVGALSFALSKALASADQENTYRVLFEKIQIIMSAKVPQQTPQIEGAIDRLLWAGGAIKQTFYAQVERYVNEKQVSIGAGNLLGFYKNSRIGLYPINTHDPLKTKPVIQGTIMIANETDCVVELDRPFNKEEILNTRAFITEQYFGNLTVRAQLLIDHVTVRETLQQAFKSSPIIQLTEESADLFIEYDKRHTLSIITRTNHKLYSRLISIEKIAYSMDEVIEQIKAYGRANYLRKMEVKNHEYDVALEIVPVITQKTVQGEQVLEKLPPNSKRSPGGQVIFGNGERFIIRIINQGNKPSYFSILDIDAADKLNILIPYGNTMASDYKINSKDILDLPYIFQFSKPFGNEVLKLIASKEPIELRQVVNSRGATRRGDATPLENLIADTFEGIRAEPVSIPKASVSIHTKIIIVQK